MSTVEEIKDAILHLPPEDQLRLRSWLNQIDDDPWDRQMREDAAAGRLDALIEEADHAIRDGKTLPFPE